MAASCTRELLLIGTESQGRFRSLSFLIEPALDQQLEFSDGSLSVISFPRYQQLCPFSGGQHQEPQDTFAIDPLAIFRDPIIRSVFVGHSDKHGCRARMQAKLILNRQQCPEYM